MGALMKRLSGTRDVITYLSKTKTILGQATAQSGIQLEEPIPIMRFVNGEAGPLIKVTVTICIKALLC